jgi:L-serine dehydratase
MISVFDMFSIGIGPSSSHTVGPMRAAHKFIELLKARDVFHDTTRVKVELFGSLGQTGIGHGTGKACILGLHGHLPESVPVDEIDSILEAVNASEKIQLNSELSVDFPKKDAIIYHRRKTLPLHANAMTIYAYNQDELLQEQTYYSIGGGFIVEHEDYQKEKDEKLSLHHNIKRPYTFHNADSIVNNISKTN